MSRLSQKNANKLRRELRIRTKLHGSAARPRLSVNISNIHVTAQLIDDDAGNTVAYATTVGNKVAKGSMSEKAALIGAEIAKNAKKANKKAVVFDKGAHAYHGRVKILADTARENGLEF